MFDSNEYFYILGGRGSNAGNAPLFNDVYRSTFPLSDLGKVAQACSVNIPYCGTGLTCWPGEGTSVYPGGVACQWTRWCEGNASNPWRPSSTGAAGPSSRSSTARPVRPFDPCRDMVPVPAECDNFVDASTGVGGGKAAGLTSWAIGGIVVLVVTVVGGLLYFFYRRARSSSASAGGKLDTHLLGATDSETA